jgi:large subunit ribosomal protein L31e
MAEKEKKSGKKEEKVVVLEREYIIPLRREWLKVPKYRRAERAITEIRNFIARHMKLYISENEIKKQVKIDKYVNEEIWFKGIKKPLHKIKIKALKYMDNSVLVTLAEIPEAIKYKVAREEKLKEEGKKKAEEKEEQKKVMEEKIKQEQEKQKSEAEKKEEKKEEKELEKITEEKQEKQKDEILKQQPVQKKEKPISQKQPKTKSKQEFHKAATGR